MIGKIYKYNEVDVYYKISSISINSPAHSGIVIKSNDSHFIVGWEYYVFPDESTEITEKQFNKIMVFE